MNKLKLIILSILFTLLLFLTTSILPVYASTSVLDTTNYYSNTDRKLSEELTGSFSSSIDEIEFTPGASLLKNNLNTMIYEITLKDETLKSSIGVNSYVFELGTSTADGTSADMGLILLLTIDNENNGVIGFGRKDVNWKESISLYGYDYEANELDTTTTAFNNYKNLKNVWDDVFTFEKEASFNNASSFINFVGENELKLYIQVDTSNVYNYYFLHFSIYQGLDYYSIISSLVSVHDILTQMNSLSSFEAELDSTIVEEAYYIVNDSTKRDVIVEYLVRVEDTPFAIKKQSKINVSVIDGTIKSSDVATALGYENMGVMQSYCGDFVYDSEKGIFTTTYQKSIWLSAKSVDGNSANYFLDCNLSYYDYYYQFVEDGIFTNDLYEYIFNKMQLDYPQISSYKPNEIYGYFGFVSIPSTYSINALWEEMFGSNKTFDGVLYKYCFTENLSLDSYNKLLQEYQYNWLEIAWNDCAGLFSGGSWNADNYLFYADVETNEAFIAENGADNIEDNDSLIENDVEDTIEDILDSDYFASLEKAFLLIALILLLGACSPILTTFIKYLIKILGFIFESIIYVITLPFRLIGKLFKRKRY